MPLTPQQTQAKAHNRLSSLRSYSKAQTPAPITKPTTLAPLKRKRFVSNLATPHKAPTERNTAACVSSNSESLPSHSSSVDFTEHSPSPRKQKKHDAYTLNIAHSKDELQVKNLASHLDIEDVPGLPSPEAARQVVNLLRIFYRRPLPSAAHPNTKPRAVLLDSLVATILSQATSNTNSSRAFANLKARFPSWESALMAGPKAIETCILCGGLAHAKSKVIYHILTRLKEEQGECSLEFIRDMSTDDAKKAMCAFKGVGPKTAACVLMFSLHRAEFPVDTHIRRIAERLGWMPQSSTSECTYESLNACLPDDIKYDLHVLLIEHGRKTCKAVLPRCDGCPLTQVCRFSGEHTPQCRI